jgi:hypothetical protein
MMRLTKGVMMHHLVELENKISSMIEASTIEVIETMVLTEKPNSTNPLPRHQKWTSQNLMEATPKNGFA